MRRLIIVLIAWVALAPNAVAQDTQPSLQQRLDRLCERLERERQELHIPGFAIAIVQDDQVILSRGFGVRDIDRDLPVTPETVFAIGSSSKAFTAALIAMLVDEGALAWDDPVRKHLPGFTLRDQSAAEQLTLRDALCHRSGLMRTDLVWASGVATRDQVLQAAAVAEPRAAFREQFHYQNVMYLAAGVASANAAGLDGDWDRLARERLFEPLNMDDTSTTLATAKAHPELSMGYQWLEDEERFRHLPMRDLSSIAPAGAINSNVTDMVQWLRLQLNRGEIDGQRLIKTERFDEMREPLIEVSKGSGVDYGLGWMIRKWNDLTVVEHGGNIDGFGAMVALVPEKRLGFVLLTNVTATPLQNLSTHIVCTELLGDWSDGAAGIDPASIEDLLGTYRVDNLKVDATVLLKDGKLAVDVPGQMVYALRPPDEEGKWVFEITDTIAVSFSRNEKGEVVAMNFHQGGLVLESPKEGAVFPIEIGLDEAQSYLGKYHDSRLNVDVQVLHRNGRLAIDVPGQMVFELHLPNEDDRWVFRATDSISARFEEDESGVITGLTLFQGGQEALLPRVDNADADGESIPTLEEVLELHRRGSGCAALEDMGVIRLRGTFDMIHQGLLDSQHTTLADGSVRFRQDIDLGNIGWISLGHDGERGWSTSSFDRDAEFPQKYSTLLRLQNLLLTLHDWTEVFKSIEIVRLDQIDERQVVVVRLALDDEAHCTAFLDRETGRTVQVEYTMPVPHVGSVTAVEKRSEWRNFDGLMIPTRWEVDSDVHGTTIATISEIETQVRVDAAAFSRSSAAARQGQTSSTSRPISPER